MAGSIDLQSGIDTVDTVVSAAVNTFDLNNYFKPAHSAAARFVAAQKLGIAPCTRSLVGGEERWQRLR